MLYHKDNYICVNNKSYEEYLEIGQTYYVSISKCYTDDIFDYNIYLSHMILYMINTKNGFEEILKPIREYNLDKLI